MATGQGITWHHIIVREKHSGDIPDTFHNVHRQVYYARYIDWLLTTPLLLLDLSLLAGLNGATIFTAVAADIVMILGGLFASFGHTKAQKWGW
jgi:bacteriorhodopsin